MTIMDTSDPLDSSQPPIVYGELSILGYNGSIHHSEKSSSSKRHKSKFLLCKRPEANGIKKSRHYILNKQPENSKAIKDKDVHSISYTFSRSQTVIVEYQHDETTDLFQIGRSSEDPIDFIVTDTLCADARVRDRVRQNQNHRHNENVTALNIAQAPINPFYPDMSCYHRYQRQLAKMHQQQLNLDPRARYQQLTQGQPAQAALLNLYAPPPINLSALMIPNSSSSHSHQQNNSHCGLQNLNNNQTANSQDRQSSSNYKRSHATQSTISRFACRILVDRKPPHKARIYAAGFDSSKNIFLGEKATKWEQDDSIDGLTTNGVLIMHPNKEFFNGDRNKIQDCSTEEVLQTDRQDVLIEPSGIWREVSVDGGIYAIRESRSAAQKGKRIETESNILQDGSLIDLCGATLLWRSLDGFKAAPTKKSLEEKIDQMNAKRPQCPVGLNTLVIPRKAVISAHHRSGHHPYVYLKCGHVQGYHDWGTTDRSNQRTCPICMCVSTVSRLSVGVEPSFYLDNGPLTHSFNPCGHAATEKTVQYWSNIKIPYGTHFFHSTCPFCATQLSTTEPPYTKLIFQSDLE